MIESKDYWDAYYASHLNETPPSPFAQDISIHLHPKRHLIDLGCGNGRDTIFFANKIGLRSTGVDQSSVAIKYLNKKYGHQMLKFLQGDFSKLPKMHDLDYAYSRFTIHSVDDRQQSKTLAWVFENLNNGGLFFIEARSTKDDLYGQGRPVGKHAYMTNHYRRFIDLNDISKQLSMLGFTIIDSKEGRGLAVYKQEDPVIIRLICQKPLIR